MGLHEASNRDYYNMMNGKIKKTVVAGTPKAVERLKKDGTTTYELIYNAIDGELENVVFHKHADFGNSWVLHLKDGNNLFAVKISEKSRYAADFLKKLPNLKRGVVYTFTPYYFENTGKQGLSIKTANGDKVQSYYSKAEVGKDGKTTYTALHGFPTSEMFAKKMDWGTTPFNKDQWKTYFDYVNLYFLKPLALEFIAKEFSGATKQDEPKSMYSDKEPPDFDSDEDVPDFF